MACLSRGAGKTRSPGSEGALAQQCAGATRQKLRYQVCGQAATDPGTGRIPWIMTDTAFRELPEDPAGGLTSAPPTCRACIPEALATCPQLGISSTVCTVARAQPAAVLADMFTPGPGQRAIPTGEHSVSVIPPLWAKRMDSADLRFRRHLRKSFAILHCRRSACVTGS